MLDIFVAKKVSKKVESEEVTSFYIKVAPPTGLEMLLSLYTLLSFQRIYYTNKSIMREFNLTL